MSETPKPPPPPTSLSCRVYVDAFFYCLSPANQLSTYYRRGTVDDCVAPWARLKTCFKMGMEPDDEKRAGLFEALHAGVTGKDSPSATVWTARADPAKTWRE